MNDSFIPRIMCFPGFPAKLGKAYYALATTHGALGTVTELAGTVHLVVRGHDRFCRKKLRITKIQGVDAKRPRASGGVVLLLGIATYTRWVRGRVCFRK